MSGKIYPICMPKWGMEMTEGDVIQWHYELGAEVVAGSELVDIETSKIVNTLMAYDNGVLRRTIAELGETYLVGQLLGLLSDGEVSEAQLDEFVATFSQPEPEVLPEPVVDIESEQVIAQPVINATDTQGTDTAQALLDLAQGGDDSELSASTIARRMAQKYNVNLHNVTATGHHGRISKRDIETSYKHAGGQLRETRAPSMARSVTAVGGVAALTDDSGVNASSVARRLAKKLNVNLHDCRASGHHGRVCKADVEAAYALSGAGDLSGENQHNLLMPTSRANAPEVEEIAFSGMRKTIGLRLQDSKQTAPHFRTVIDVEVDKLLALRSELNLANPEMKISLNDMLIKACALALIQVPDLNIQFDGEVIKRFADADISVAVSLDNGLITPVVRQANRLTLSEISGNMKDLAARAKSRELKPDEFVGGTFTISNLGMFGVKQFDAIINPPQAAILAVGATESRAVVNDGSLQFRQVLTLTLSSDHRVIDGALAASYLQVLKNCLQQPQSLLV